MPKHEILLYYTMALCAIAAISLVVLSMQIDRPKAVSTSPVHDTTEAICEEYLTILGYDCGSCIERKEITIPQTFDKVYTNYNALQKEAGYDLLPFAGKTVTRCTYRIRNFSNDISQEVRANLFVYQNEIIGGDFSSTALAGTMLPLGRRQ